MEWKEPKSAQTLGEFCAHRHGGVVTVTLPRLNCTNIAACRDNNPLFFWSIEFWQGTLNLRLPFKLC